MILSIKILFLRNGRLKKTLGILLLIGILGLFINPIQAKDIQINKTTEYILHKDYLEIVESKTITNKSSTNAYNVEYLQFSLQKYYNDADEELQNEIKSLTTNKSTSDITYQNNQYIISVPIGNVYPGDSITAEITYTSYQLFDQIGLLKTITIPKYISTTYENYDYNENILVKLPTSITKSTFASQPTDTYTEDGYTIYPYPASAMQNSSIYFQIGTQQVYQFKITQNTKTSYEYKYLPFSYNEYILTLPADYSENNQQTYIKSIEPEPYKYSKDTNSNYFAHFLIPSGQDTPIEISGYIVMSLPENGPNNSSTISKIPNNLKYLTEGKEYWETTSKTVEKFSNMIKEPDNIMEIIRESYNIVVTNLSYDDSKYKNNIRMGAEKALSGSSSVCMEFSDALIAILRKKGIPARAAYGRGFNPRLPISEQEDHQWVQAYVPDYGWLTIDPTWGENGRTYIGPDIERVLWYVSEDGPNEVGTLSHRSAEELKITAPDITFNPIDKIDPHQEVYLLKDLVENSNKEPPLSQFVTNLKVSLASRLLDQYFVFIVIIFVLIIAFITISVLAKILSLLKHKKKKTSPIHINSINNPTEKQKPNPVTMSGNNNNLNNGSKTTSQYP